MQIYSYPRPIRITWQMQMWCPVVCMLLCSPFVADLIVGMEELELHCRRRGRSNFRKIRIANISVRMVSEGFLNLSGSARSGFGARNEADRCSSPPQVIVLAAVWRADRPSPIIHPDRRTDPGKQKKTRSGYNYVGAVRRAHKKKN